MWSKGSFLSVPLKTILSIVFDLQGIYRYPFLNTYFNVCDRFCFFMPCRLDSRRPSSTNPTSDTSLLLWSFE